MNIKNIDCLEAMKSMEDNAFELAIVDPPYRNINNPTSRMRKHKKGDRMKNFGKKPEANFFQELFRVSKNQIVWGSNYFSEYLPSTQSFIFWHKTAGNDIYSDGELAWTSFDKKAKYVKLDPRTLNQEKIHLTQKPVELYQWLLNNFASSGDRILDTHLGSGTIAIACKNLGFDLTAFEINEEYYKSALDYIDKHTRQKTIFSI